MTCKINKIDNCQDGCDECEHFVDTIRSIGNFTTKELIEELRKRENVNYIDVKPNNSYYISVDEDFEDIEIDEVGPATILVVID